MREVPSVRKVHTEDCVAVLKRCEIHRHVGLTSRMRLDVHVLCAKKLLCPLDRKPLHNIAEFTTTVIPSSWITLGILVREYGTSGFEDRLRHEVL